MFLDLGLSLVGDELQDAAQVLEVEQWQAVVVAVLEHQGEHALLRIVQFQDAPQQHRAEFGDRGAQACAGLIAQAQQLHRHGLGHIGLADLGMARLDLFVARPGCRNAAEVTLHVHHQYGYSLER